MNFLRDLFGRRKIKGLEAELRLQSQMFDSLLDSHNELAKELDAANTRCAELVDELRAIDTALWNFSQSINPDQARKAIAPALSAMERRKVAESKRIESILIPELKRTYGQ